MHQTPGYLIHEKDYRNDPLLQLPIVYKLPILQATYLQPFSQSTYLQAFLQATYFTSNL